MSIEFCLRELAANMKRGEYGIRIGRSFLDFVDVALDDNSSAQNKYRVIDWSGEDPQALTLCADCVATVHDACKLAVIGISPPPHEKTVCRNVYGFFNAQKRKEGSLWLSGFSRSLMWRTRQL